MRRDIPFGVSRQAVEEVLDSHLLEGGVEAFEVRLVDRLGDGVLEVAREVEVGELLGGSVVGDVLHLRILVGGGGGGDVVAQRRRGRRGRRERRLRRRRIGRVVGAEAVRQGTVARGFLLGELDALDAATKLVLVVDEAGGAGGGPHLVRRGGAEGSAVRVGVLGAGDVAARAGQRRGHSCRGWVAGSG